MNRNPKDDQYEGVTWKIMVTVF